MWRPCRGSPSRAKLVPGLHIKGLSNKSPDRCRRRGFTVLPPTGGIINSLPLKGKRLTTFCASLTLLHPLLSLTHWIFRSLMLPYKSSSLVQNVFAVHRKAAIHNPRAKGPSNLRTLRPIGPVNLKNFFHNLFLQPFYTTCGEAAPPLFFIICGVSRHHNPRAKGPSNLRTLRPIGPVHLKNLFLGTQDAKCPSFTISPLTWPPEACILLSN